MVRLAGTLVGQGSTEPPAWFREALSAKVQLGTVVVAGARVSYRAWGDPGVGGVVLVHGGAAHGRWWDHVGPLLAGARRVVALDLSGHGDSERRDSYTLDAWAEEVVEVAGPAGIDGPVTLIGHSMGGAVALRAADLFGARLAGAVVVDSPLRVAAAGERAVRERRALTPLQTYSSYETAISRFRPVPDQGHAMLSYVTAHVAATSVWEVNGRWTWKFDPAIFGRPDLALDLLRPLACRIALFRAEYGRLTTTAAEVAVERLGGVAPVIELPAAGHHVMLDQPLVLVAGLRTLLSDWAHSVPRLAAGS